MSGLAVLIPFYDAIRPLMPTFTELRQEATLEKEKEPEDIGLLEEIYCFEQRYAQEKASSSSKHNAFGTFQGRPEGNGTTNSNNVPKGNHSNDEQPYRTNLDCLCGQKHRFRKCPYVNPAVRPTTWSPDATIQARFDGSLPPASGSTQ